MTVRQVAKQGQKWMRIAHVRSLALARGVSAVRTRLQLPDNGTCDFAAPAADDRCRILHVEQSPEFHRPLPQLPNRPETASYFAGRATEPAFDRMVVELRHARVAGFSEGTVLSAAGRLIPAISRDPWGPRLHTALTRWSFPRADRLGGATLNLLTPEAANNYHHWLLDLLPRWALVARAGFLPADFDQVLVPPNSADYATATLVQLGFSPEQLLPVTTESAWQVEQLITPTLKPHNQCLPAADAEFLRARFLPAAGPSFDAPRRLYLSRRDARFRRLQNEPAFRELLLGNGFVDTTMDGRSVEEQAALIAGAEIIVAPAGAALANLVFASPGCQVIELTAPGWLTVYHWMVSARLGLNHTILCGSGAAQTGVLNLSNRTDDIALSPETLAFALGTPA